MEKLNTSSFLVKERIQLKEWNTKPAGEWKDSDKKEFKSIIKELASLQEIMYAHNRYGVLVILQGMDTSGKDSLIREVFSEFNPRGVVVNSFKVPSELELQHDYLWRHYAALPERGKFAIFNRSHYENVLVTRVNPQFLLKENLPGLQKLEDLTPDFWDRRFEQINNFEKHIIDNGTVVLKFFLNLGKEEQRKRLLRRLETKKHNWKFSPGDLKERSLWNDYMRCYEEAINRTSTSYAPWHIIPADDKKLARLAVARVILEKMKTLDDIKMPELEPQVQENLEMYRQQLESEKS